jgi:hypothetical protein
MPAKESRSRASYTLMWGETGNGQWWWSVTDGPVLIMKGNGCLSSESAETSANAALDNYWECHTTE